jgi:hypothetical protein
MVIREEKQGLTVGGRQNDQSVRMKFQDNSRLGRYTEVKDMDGDKRTLELGRFQSPPLQRKRRRALR